MLDADDALFKLSLIQMMHAAAFHSVDLL